MAEDTSINNILALLEEHPEWKEPLQIWMAQTTLANIRLGVGQLTEVSEESSELASKVLENISTLSLELVGLWRRAAERIGMSEEDAESMIGRLETPPAQT